MLYGVLYVLYGVLYVLYGVLYVLYGVLSVLYGVLSVLYGVLSVLYINRVNGFFRFAESLLIFFNYNDILFRLFCEQIK